MDLAFRVEIDTPEHPTILKSQDWAIGDKFVRKTSEHYVIPCVHEIKAILYQYLPNIRFPACNKQDIYLIADGLVLSSDKATKVKS